MATPSFQSLTPAQKRMALAKWHAKTDAKTSLTPEQAKKAALAQVVAPGLTRGQLNQTVAADTGLRYGSTEKDLRAQPGRINSAFAAYKQAIANASNNLTGSGDQVGGSYGGAVQQVKDLQSGLDQTAKDQWAGQQQAMAADAASRGATADPKLADVAHNASNVRNILTGSYGAMLLGQGANARQGFADRSVNAEQQRGEQQSGVRANLQKLLAEKGAFKTSDAQTIVSNTFSNALKQALERSQVGNTRSEIATRRTQTKISQQNADTSATSAKQSQTQWAKSSNKYGVTNGEWANWSDAKRQSWINALPSKSKANATGKDQFGNTSKDRQRSQNSWDRAKTIGKLIGGKDVQSLASEIVFKDASVPPWMALAAAQQIVNGYVGPNSAQKLGRAGVKGGVSTTKPKVSAPVIPGVSQVVAGN